MTRCTKCWSDVGIDVCGEQVAGVVKDYTLQLEGYFKLKGCQDSDRYPSFKCFYHFYTTWFFVVPLIVILLIGFIVIYCVMRTRTRKRAKKTRQKRNSMEEVDEF